MRRRSRIDLSRVAATALDTAIYGDRPHRRFRLSSLGAVATGAALVAAGRVAVAKAPALPGLSNLTELADGVRDRLAERGWLEEAEEEPVDEEEWDEEEPEGGEEGEGDDRRDEPDDEDGGGPEAEGDEENRDEEPEDEEQEEDPGGPSPGVELGANGGGESTRAQTPDVMQLLGPHGPPPVMRQAQSRGRKQLDPAARPPKPPKAKAARK